MDGRRTCNEALSGYGARVHLAYEPRQDVYAGYVSGWRIAIAQRLSRIDVSAHDDTAGVRTHVRRYHLTYDPSSFHSLLTQVQVEGRPQDCTAGYCVGLTNIPESSSVAGERLPPMTFEYTHLPTGGTASEAVPGFGGIGTTVRAVTNSPPHSVDEARSDLFDVNSDGLPDLVVTDPARYRTSDGRPAVGVFFNGFTGLRGTPAGETASFSDAVPMAIPYGLDTVMSLGNANVVPMDIDGDGRGDLLHMPRLRDYGWWSATRRGVDEVNVADQGWEWTYANVRLPADDTDPRIDLGRDAQHIRVLDVNNDHLIDVVRTTGTVMQTWVNLGWLPGGEGRFGSYRYLSDGTAGSSTVELSTEPFESCLLQGGTPLDFEDPEVRLGDMNGDGLQDIVQMRRGRVIYWPGRGEGVWGTGSRECPRGEGANRYVEMADPPAEVNPELDGVYLSDVDMDGTDDMVQVRFREVDVWFNEAGQGWTRRPTARDMPTAPAFAPRVRFTDIDGSATTDIVWANAGRWEFIDPTGGQRPRLLVGVRNGLGADTSIEYGSSAEDYVRDLADAGSSAEPFDWNADPIGPDLMLCELSGQSGSTKCGGTDPDEWLIRSAGSPVISTVVRAVSTTDNFAVLGRESQVSESRFSYHDAYYEGIEQEFRGFGAADATTIGDWNNPTVHSRTWFLQGRRPSDIAGDRLAHNPYEALKGREYMTEVFDDDGAYLSTSVATLANRMLATGVDGRPIHFVYVRDTNEVRYDTTPFVAGTATFDVDLSSVVGLVRAESDQARPSWYEGAEALPDNAVVRTFSYDRHGRRVASHDPDTDDPDGSTGSSTWRYLYNKANDLIAVRDPRGCGQNFFYDHAGRLRGEQYVMCAEAQRANAEGPSLSVQGLIGQARISGYTTLDVEYDYDTYDEENGAAYWAHTIAPSGPTQGRATGVADRGQRAAIAYDNRGNATWTARQMAVISDELGWIGGIGTTDDGQPFQIEQTATNGTVTYDGDHTYVRTAVFDHAGRPRQIELPADPDFSGTAPVIHGELDYNLRGLPSQARAYVDTTEQVIVQSIEYLRDGLVSSITYGDNEDGTNPSMPNRTPTQSRTTYDVRRRPTRMWTTRQVTGLSDGVGEHSPLDDVTVVVDQQLGWDAANNLIAITDHRDPSQWGAGNLPQSVEVRHDALYRVIRADYSYTQTDGSRTPFDVASDWRTSLPSANDPMRPEPAPMGPIPPTDRVMTQTWSWDYLANQTDTGDQTSLTSGTFYERSLGAITNGDDVSDAPRPTAIYFAHNMDDASSPDQAGWLQASYGVGGNLLQLTVHAQCREYGTSNPCTVSGTTVEEQIDSVSVTSESCECDNEQSYVYRWDELNRLAEARRYDQQYYGGWSLAVRQRYRYDGANQRTIKQTLDQDGCTPGTTCERTALYVYPGDFERRGLTRGVGTYDASSALGTETQYVVAGARMVLRDVDYSSVTDDLYMREARMVTPVSDLIGTTSAAFDVRTGRLVEASTYYPNGARETLVARTDAAAEPMGFTGKEGDEEVGLVYFGERYLVPRLGRWASPDPLAVHVVGGGGR